jgi:hypothetical protein
MTRHNRLHQERLLNLCKETQQVYGCYLHLMCCLWISKSRSPSTSSLC